MKKKIPFFFSLLALLLSGVENLWIDSLFYQVSMFEGESI